VAREPPSDRVLLPVKPVFRYGSGWNGRAIGSREADLDAPGGHLGVFLLADEVDLGGADVGVVGELPHLVEDADRMPPLLSAVDPLVFIPEDPQRTALGAVCLSLLEDAQPNISANYRTLPRDLLRGGGSVGRSGPLPESNGSVGRSGGEGDPLGAVAGGTEPCYWGARPRDASNVCIRPCTSLNLSPDSAFFDIS